MSSITNSNLSYNQLSLVNTTQLVKNDCSKWHLVSEKSLLRQKTENIAIILLFVLTSSLIMASPLIAISATNKKSLSTGSYLAFATGILAGVSTACYFASKIIASRYFYFEDKTQVMKLCGILLEDSFEKFYNYMEHEITLRPDDKKIKYKLLVIHNLITPNSYDKIISFIDNYLLILQSINAEKNLLEKTSDDNLKLALEQSLSLLKNKLTSFSESWLKIQEDLQKELPYIKDYLV